MARLLDIERLKVLSDSVLLVAITILAYNITPPALINGELAESDIDYLLSNVYGMINSFIVIAVLWVLFTKILECIPEIDDFILITSLVFFMLVLMIPAFSVAQFEYMTLQSVISLALLQIIVSSLLLAIGLYSSKALTRKIEFVKNDNTSQQDIRNIVWRIIVIPGVYVVTIGIALFLNLYIATIFPIIIAPLIVLLFRRAKS